MWEEGEKKTSAENLGEHREALKALGAASQRSGGIPPPHILSPMQKDTSSSYVNDILLKDSDEAVISAAKDSLHQHFVMQDVGTPCYFLGIELGYQPKKLAPFQRNYALDMFNKQDS